MTRVENVSNPGPVIVIGSGPAGAAAALFLSRAGVETLVLEAGPQDAPLGFTARLRGFTFAKRKPSLQQRPDFRAVDAAPLNLFEELAPGGLSNHWSCAVPRFSEEDFLDAQRAGEAYTWPISYADIVPWYERVEPLLRIAGDSRDSPHLPSARAEHSWQLAAEWLSVAHAAEALERSVVAMPYANGKTTMATRSGTAFNAYSQLVLPALHAKQLSVHYDAHALRLEWSAADQRVVAVICRNRRSGRDERIACSAVVLAAGAVNSAQILLQSSSREFPEGLGNEHGVVGRYLHDHPLGKMTVDLPSAVPIHPASYFTRQSLERAQPLYAAACMQWCGAPALVRSVLQGRPGRSRQLGFTVFGTMVPTADDYVALAPAQEKGVLIRLRHPPAVKQTLEHARDETLEILQRAGWRPHLNEWWTEEPGSSVHYAGTCRMHASPRYGVVDGNSRMHAVPNVAVADSSVFTTGPEKNPVLTAMALAARAADLLARDLRAI